MQLIHWLAGPQLHMHVCYTLLSKLYLVIAACWVCRMDLTSSTTSLMFTCGSYGTAAITTNTQIMQPQTQDTASKHCQRVEVISLLNWLAF